MCTCGKVTELANQLDAMQRDFLTKILNLVTVACVTMSDA
ncbi:hypothetical protein COLO4_38490 [Corchorus olitorius]|nr:hypothetical protein COLO4_38490 [Corchorus olitorius]